MKRFTLIIDGHNFFFRSLWGIFKQGGKKVLSTKNDKDVYEKKLMMDFCNVVKQMGSVLNDIVFIEDSHSWRKDLLLEQEYKGNRKKNQDNIDKDGFNEVVSSFSETLKKSGIKVSQVERSEGDDLIYAWSETLFQNGKSSLILSTDRDLTQLVKCVNGVHIIQYAPLTNKMYVSKESNDFIKSLDEKRELTPENLFGEPFTVFVESDPFRKLISNMEIEVVEPEVVRFMKVVSGDASDNIYPVYYKRGDDNTRSKGIGKKTAEKIYNEFRNKIGCPFNYMIYMNDDALMMLSNIIYEVVKIKDENFTKRMLVENLKTNAKLVVLSDETIPDYVMSDMVLDISNEILKDSVLISKITKERLFSNSRFKDYKSTIQINALKGVKDDGDMSFIKD
jgi:5'-3' exonuclease